ncbi:hypothetical protein ACFY5C_07845 [Streptomyces sp. NPDC012935]|uniref:hypothetical protein n=1 Tax=Streptomyces sp. NPDC012935 TaxID=3364857 RepID=UPI0036BC22B8
MRSLLAAIVSLFLPARGAHRAVTPPPPLPSCPPAPVHSPAPARPPRPPHQGVINADGLPLVRSYVVVWERERSDLERRRLRRARSRTAARAALGADCFPWEAAV